MKTVAKSHEERSLPVTRKAFSEYKKSLKGFDAAACQAIAVSQQTSARFVHPTIGYGSFVFGRMGANAVSILNAAPKSRWAFKWWPNWDLSSLAGHVRAILEGWLLLNYLLEASQDEDTQRAYLHLMHLYDCKKRLSIFPAVLPSEEIEGFEVEAGRISEVLRNTRYFRGLSPKAQKAALSGQHLMFRSRLEAAKDCGLSRQEFEFYWNYLSQYTHIFSLQFYRVERNGRGTGLKNQFDLEATAFVLRFGAEILTKGTTKMVEAFPDSASVMRGTWSSFSPGPPVNNFQARVRKLFRA